MRETGKSPTAAMRSGRWNTRGRPAGPLLEKLASDGLATPESTESPLQQMTDQERLVADFSGTGLSPSAGIPWPFVAKKWSTWASPPPVTSRTSPTARTRGRIVIARQRPGTAKGFLFLSLEDETGIANVIVTPKLYERFRTSLTGQPFLLVEGALQRQDGAISVKARHVEALPLSAASPSRDFR